MRIPRGHGLQCDVAMIETFDVSREHGIPIVAMAGARLILDTGSPVSFARNGSITLGGCEHQVPVDCWAGSPDSLGELLGAPVDGLLGCDLLAGRILDLDCPAGRAHVISEDTSPDNAVLACERDCAAVQHDKGRSGRADLGQWATSIGGRRYRCRRLLCRTVPACGHARHRSSSRFSPRLGRFETDLHLVSIGLGGGASPVDVAVAAAPPALDPLLAGLGLQAILGGDLLMGSEVLFDFRARVRCRSVVFGPAWQADCGLMRFVVTIGKKQLSELSLIEFESGRLLDDNSLELIALLCA